MNKLSHHLIEVDEATANALDYGEQIDAIIEDVRNMDFDDLIKTQDTRQVAEMFIRILDDISKCAFGIVGNLNNRNEKALEELFKIAGVQRA